MVAFPPMDVPGEIRIPTEAAGLPTKVVAFALATPLLLNCIFGVDVVEKVVLPALMFENEAV